ncbi:MAG: single-stranded DNA-binding protein [Ruminococcaceae bacterium]|nr:single-stranded DNA-binding protein [Oscillospiraceae bacterium]
MDFTGDMSERNSAVISGKIETELAFSHEVYGEGFYCFNVSVMRLSNTYDVIPVIVSERLMESSEYKIGRFVKIEGQFRSYNSLSGGPKLSLMVFARDVFFPEIEEEQEDINQVVLNGFICKPPVYRTTPFNREITDILLAVNRAYNKSDYIPCISWGRNARYCGRRQVGDNVIITGRIQSRKYQKKLPDGNVLDKVAYEVSISKLELINKEEIQA